MRPLPERGLAPPLPPEWNAPVTRGRMRAQFPLPHGPGMEWDASADWGTVPKAVEVQYERLAHLPKHMGCGTKVG